MKENIDNEEEENNLQSNLIISRVDSTMENVFRDDPDDTGEKQQNSCCCCCGTNEKSKSSFRKGWKEFLINEGNDSANIPFQMLTKLFINEEDAIEGLKNIRLNPNLVSENKLRNDLEFYIPQLCTFLLFGDFKALEEFFVFLCRVCNSSFFFAHRVYWFLSAMINTLFKSEDKKKQKKIEKFYVTNSEKYIDYIKENSLYFLYNTDINEKENIFDKINFNSLDMTQQQIFNKFKNGREIIITFSQNEYIREKEKEINKLKKEGKLKNNSDIINTDIDEEEKIKIKSLSVKKNKKLKPDEFFIDISNFKLSTPDIIKEDDDIIEVDEGEENDEKKQSILYDENSADDFINLGKLEKDINFISYHSTLNFIEHLCDISNDLPKHPIEEQKLFLFKKLNEINKKLPCNVYLPFLQDSIRNYFICHIPIDGVKIFRTKTRCPIMLTFEMVRIDEINQEINKENLPIPGNSRLTISPENLKSVKKTKAKGHKLLLDIITEEDYNEADYDLSKPITIEKNKDKNKKEEKNRNKINDTSDIENKKFLKISNQFKNKNKLVVNLQRRKTTVDYQKSPKLSDLDINTSTQKKEKSQQKKIEEIIEEPKETMKIFRIFSVNHSKKRKII